MAACLNLIASMAHAAPARDYPVILVPGAGGDFSRVKPIIDRLEQEGRQVLTFKDFEGAATSRLVALRVENHVRQTASTYGKADLACFSAGVLSCRWAMKYRGISGMVRRAVWFAGGDGSYVSCLLPRRLGGDGCYTSSFARSLKVGDDTPGPAEYYLITSFPTSAAYPQDYTVIPDGGICYKYVAFDGFSHPDEPFQSIYQDSVALALNGVCPGDFINLPITTPRF